MWREAFRRAADPEAYFTGAHVRALMDQVARPSSTPLPDVLDGLAAWRTAEAARFAAVQADRALLVQSSPMASVLGCWLQGLSAPGVFEDEVQLKAMALLAGDVGVGRPESSRYDEFRLLLRRERLTELSLDAIHLPSVREIDDELFALPTVLQAASRRSDRFLFWLVGVDRALRAVGLLPGWSALRRTRAGAIDWRRLDLSSSPETRDPRALSAEIAEACCELGDEAREEVAAGAAWIKDALAAWHARLLEACHRASDPEQAMAALLTSRAREASIYHRDFTLEGRSLSCWLRDGAENPIPLVRALSRSKLVRPGNAARSPLVNGLVGSRGPMFRIFSPADLTVIRRWIDSLPPARAGRLTPRAVHPRTTIPYGEPAPGPEDGAEDGATPGSLREAYHLLQGRALAPRTRQYALDYVRAWLDRSRKQVGKSANSLPSEWPARGLRSWLLDQHDRHDHEYGEQDAAHLPTREAVIADAVQLAPLTLIDGAWLQGFTDIRLAAGRVGAALFATYWDELGNGQVELNHPAIYRGVLRQMGVELPPTGSREFAHDERIREESLRLPVYWLCLGKLPATFQPEILGMNLAMELSGVGGGYRSAGRFLRHYGFSTRFVDIHNTIDNVSTGHSAWAADAIDTYLRANPGHWERVRVGYESLSPAKPRRLRRRPHPGPALHHPPIRMNS